MRVLVQRVSSAKVEVDGSIVGEINNGLLLYVCFEQNDTHEAIEKALNKILKLRIFEDENQKMNLSVTDINASILSISQFTLSWDGQRGHRPSFDNSMPPLQAKLMYRKFNDLLKESKLNIQEGQFGSDMKVTSVNDGPATFFLNF